jgi:hypothetical protein
MDSYLALFVVGPEIVLELMSLQIVNFEELEVQETGHLTWKMR